MELLVHPKEKAYFSISLAISLLVYLSLILTIIGIIYIVVGAIIGLIIHGLFIGYIRGNGIRVSDKQFPEIYRLVQELANQMELKRVPEVYILQAGGLLNAFVTRFLSRDFVVIYSDVLELAYEEGEPALAFVVCHELAHIKRGHLTKRLLLYPAMSFPFLGSAYSRACEFTCDRFAAHYRPDGAVSGLLVLAAGKRLYRNVDSREFLNQTGSERGFWIWLSELISSHPHLSSRVDAIDGSKVAIQHQHIKPQVEGI